MADDERVRYGNLGSGEFGIKVSRLGVDVAVDDAPNLYSALDSQQVILSGRIDASNVSNTFGSSTFYPFGTTLSYVPVMLFELASTTESDLDATQRIVVPFDYENNSLTDGTLFGIMSVKPSTTGFTLIPAWRRVTSGSYVTQTGWAFDYYVTKMEMP